MPKFGMSQLAPALAWPKYFYQGFNRQHFRKVLSYRPIAYWPFWEPSGSVAYDISKNGLHGAYTGVTLGQIGIGDGRTCPLFDGANDYVNVYSTGLRDAFNGAAGTVSIWLKCAAASAWDDGDIKAAVRLGATSDNDVQLRITSANTFRWRYQADGTSEEVNLAALSTLDWFHVAITWDKAADEMKAFYNGIQTGSTQAIAETWDGTLQSINTNIGAYTQAPTLPWYGNLDHPSVFDSALTPTMIADLAVV